MEPRLIQITGPDELTRRPVIEPAPIALLGASYMAGWNLRHVAGRPVVNCAIPGNQTHEYVARFDRDVAALRPRAVVIWGIDNDVIRAPLGQAEEAGWRVERNLAHLVQMARARGIEPILSTDLTLRPPARWYEPIAELAGWLRGKEGYQQRINAQVIRLNERIRALAACMGARLLDIYPLTADYRGQRKRAFAKPDGSHLTDAGYRAIETYVIPRLETWLADPERQQAAPAG